MIINNDYLIYKMIYTEIPEDIISEIFRYLQYREHLSLSITCNLYNKIYKYNTSVVSKFNTVRLKFSQYLAICQIEEKTMKEIILCAPYGFGKTITSLYYAFKTNTKDNMLFIVPPNLINKVWIPEITKLNLYNANPDKSDVLVLHTTRPNHSKKNIDNKLSTLFLSHRVILTSYHKAYSLIGKATVVIVDEAHKVNINIDCDKKILLTAETKIKHMGDNFITAGIINKDIIPTVKYEWYYVNNSNKMSTYSTHIDNFKNNLEEFKDIIIKTITKYNKTCLFVDRGTIGDLVLDILKDLDYKLFTVKSSFESVLEKHLKYKDKSILLLPSNANEGINLLIDNIIIIKPDIYHTTRLKQTYPDC